MTSLATGVAVVQVGGLGAAYVLVNGVEGVPGVNPLEVIPTAEGAVCLLEGTTEALRSLVREQRSADLIAVSVIPSCPREVLNAFYCLDVAPLNSQLIIIEHEVLGKVFEIAVQAQTLGFGLVELKAARGGQRRSSLLLTLKAGSLAVTSEQESWLRRLKAQTGCQLERIDRLGKALLSFFEGIE